MTRYLLDTNHASALWRDNDLQIAAIALANSLVVLTSDRRHFNRIPDLKCENWLQQPAGD